MIGLTQSDLALKTGVRRYRISLIERGVYRPSAAEEELLISVLAYPPPRTAASSTDPTIRTMEAGSGSAASILGRDSGDYRDSETDSNRGGFTTAGVAK